MGEGDQGPYLPASHQRDQAPAEVYTSSPVRDSSQSGQKEGGPVLDKAFQDLLQLKAIQVVHKDTKVFLSSAFTVPKLERGREYGKRFILNLKVNSSLVTQGLRKTVLFLTLPET